MYLPSARQRASSAFHHHGGRRHQPYSSTHRPLVQANDLRNDIHRGILEGTLHDRLFHPCVHVRAVSQLCSARLDCSCRICRLRLRRGGRRHSQDCACGTLARRWHACACGKLRLCRVLCASGRPTCMTSGSTSVRTDLSARSLAGPRLAIFENSP